MSVRIDKWLWAARFFKTRAKAKESIDGGKVHLNGQRTKPSKDIAIGDTLKITQGYDEKVINVLVLSDNRRAASIAQTLYEETEESVKQRELRAEQRRAAGQNVASEGRPTKKDRRMIHRFRDNNQG
ncbi:MAG: ribosome-associated heat shock protein Hsp15 [Candidatus Azotimanducaceae bacterium]|jgi:ribosome-associated heat shock protein Hsp15